MLSFRSGKEVAVDLFADNALMLNAGEQFSGGGRRWMSVASLERILSREEYL